MYCSLVTVYLQLKDHKVEMIEDSFNIALHIGQRESAFVWAAIVGAG